MRTKEEIMKKLDDVEGHLNANPLSLEDWAHWEGQKQSLMFALNIEKYERRDIRKMLEGANDKTIKKAQEKLSNATGFGIPPNQCIDDH